MSTNIYENRRTNRKFRVYTKNIRTLNSTILGGRYVDIFGNSAQNGTSSTGFCGEEYAASSSDSKYVEFGYLSSRTNASPVSYSLNITNGVNAVTNIYWNRLERLQRLLIIPDKINKIDNSNTFKSL